MSFSTAAILPSKTATSLFPSKLFAGSMTWPPLSSKSYRGNGLLTTCALATKTTNNAVNVQIAFAVCRMRAPFDAGNFLFQKPSFAPNWMSRLSSACSPSPKRALPRERVTLVRRLIVPAEENCSSNVTAAACCTRPRLSRIGHLRTLHQGLPPSFAPCCSLLSASQSAFPHQIAVEPVDGATDGVNLVLALRESVAFVRVVVGIHHTTFLLKDIHHLLGFFLRNTGVVITLEY